MKDTQLVQSVMQLFDWAKEQKHRAEMDCAAWAFSNDRIFRSGNFTSYSNVAKKMETLFPWLIPVYEIKENTKHGL